MNAPQGDPPNWRPDRAGHAGELEGEEPSKPRVWPSLLILPLAFMSVVASSACALAIAGVVIALTSSTQSTAARLDSFTHSAFGVSSLVFASGLSMTLSALAAALASPTRWYERLRLMPTRVSTAEVVLAALGLAGFSSAMGALLEALGLGKEGTISMMNEAFSHMPAWQIPLAIFCVGVLPGVGEELLFRGYVQTRFEQRWGLIGIVPTALAFGLYHMDLWQGLFAALAGLWLGFVASRAQSIVPTMIAHAASNALAVVGSVVAGSTEKTSTQDAWTQAGFMGSVAAISMALFVFRTRRLAE
ncbi:MAG: CPBP family intramembrane glutamic endopeptidase [Polyangiaceae bacterium]